VVGVAYVCFIIDAFSRMIVGWRVAALMRTDMVLDALEMARWSRGTHLDGLVAHSDAGSGSRVFATANASRNSEHNRRLAPSVTATTTRSPRR
jgi:transposase InsO family protein